MSASRRETLQDFSILEILIVKSVRAIGVVDLKALDCYEQEFHALIGAQSGQSAVFELCRLGKLLRRFGRRQWSFNPIEADSITVPEAGVLTMIAAHQEGQRDRARAIARWFCSGAEQEDIAEMTQFFARRLTKRNLKVATPGAMQIDSPRQQNRPGVALVGC